MPIWCRLLRHCVFLALSFALANAGKSIAARIAMIAITTNSSIRVNALRNAEAKSQGRPLLPALASARSEDMLVEPVGCVGYLVRNRKNRASPVSGKARLRILPV